MTLLPVERSNGPQVPHMLPILRRVEWTAHSTLNRWLALAGLPSYLQTYCNRR